MNAVVKKEIRLLFPSWCVAMLLAMVQAITRPYDFYIAFLMFCGLAFMALTTLGREASLKTFSLLLAQPVERVRFWQVKLTVLVVAFLSVFATWLAAFWVAYTNMNALDQQNSYNLFISVCLIGMATFTGGLWTTLLLRQVAGALWLTLLVPAVLSGSFAGFLVDYDANYFMIAVVSVVIGLYSLGGFFFARWMFFRAQDVGWSGGILALPEWKSSAADARNVPSPRRRRPLMALIKKEFQVQHASLMGAGALLVIHAGVIVLRSLHDFRKNSLSFGLVTTFWIVWLILPPVIASTSVAEERRLGVLEGQLCLPFSRWRQFFLKACIALGLGIVLGGLAPVLVEELGAKVGDRIALLAGEPVLKAAHALDPGLPLFILILAAGLGLVSLFASSLSKNFLQAIGLSTALMVGLGITIPMLTKPFLFWRSQWSGGPALPTLVAGPVLVVTLLWLSYVNFKDFREGWPLVRRQLCGFLVAFISIIGISNLMYHRAWECFMPQRAHGPAVLSLKQSLHFRKGYLDDLQLWLPDGRFWYDRLAIIAGGSPGGSSTFRFFKNELDPLPVSAGPAKFLSGSNWVSAVVRRLPLTTEGVETNVWYYVDVIGVRADGTLWISDHSYSRDWNGDRLTQVGDETNWQSVAWQPRFPAVKLLKKDGTLWSWGPLTWGGARHHATKTTPLGHMRPYRLGSEAGWKAISENGLWLEKTNGTIWRSPTMTAEGDLLAMQVTNWTGVALDQIPPGEGYPFEAWVRKDGTLWAAEHWEESRQMHNTVFQVGTDSNWVAAVNALGPFEMSALKADGTLWAVGGGNFIWGPGEAHLQLHQLGKDHDWVAIQADWDSLQSLAADGSIWAWPVFGYYQGNGLIGPRVASRENVTW
jgi:ABC-type Na+ efflux pump permease subunit